MLPRLQYFAVFRCAATSSEVTVEISLMGSRPPRPFTQSFPQIDLFPSNAAPGGQVIQHTAGWTWQLRSAPSPKSAILWRPSRIFR